MMSVGVLCGVFVIAEILLLIEGIEFIGVVLIIIIGDYCRICVCCNFFF
ncbi:MAG TPA: hypothetical protein PLS50_08480 [Candidatus Dojkabacteria bacterium]|nr:hypothetical protein [Candidatus Dojkabacteria bacterium]